MKITQMLFCFLIMFLIGFMVGFNYKSSIDKLEIDNQNQIIRGNINIIENYMIKYEGWVKHDNVLVRPAKSINKK